MKKNILNCLLILPAIMVSLTTSCAKKDNLPAWVDYINDPTVKLSLDYNDRTFIEDGIEEVSLATAIDGDTAHFRTADNDLIKARYYGIDTPESTGKVQPFGRGASNFNKEKLHAADEHGTIVITSVSVDQYEAPEFDSTGERYVSLIWINTEKEHAPSSELTLLNLWIVQEGWSDVKNVNDLPEYQDIFYAANRQARIYKKNLYSGVDDPLFNYGGYEEAIIPDISKEIIASMQDESHVNAFDGRKVRFNGTVAGLSNNILYLTTYDEETGENYGVNFFTGMGAVDSRYTTPGAYLEVFGLCQDDENFGFQLTDGNFNIYSSADSAAKVVYEASENTEYPLHVNEFKPSELGAEDYDVLNCAVSLTEEVVVRNCYINQNTYTLYLEDTKGNPLDFDIYIPFTYYWKPGDYTTRVDDASTMIGEKFNLSHGIYTFHKTTSGKINWQITICNNKDFLVVE